MMTNAGMNVCVRVEWTYVFTSLGYTPRSGIAGSYVILYLIIEEWPNCFPKQLPHFTFSSAVYKYRMIFPHPHHLLLLSVLLIPAILVGGKWCLVVVLIYVPWWPIILSIFSCMNGPFVHLLWRNIYSSIWKNVYFFCLF